MTDEKYFCYSIDNTVVDTIKMIKIIIVSHRFNHINLEKVWRTNIKVASDTLMYFLNLKKKKEKNIEIILSSNTIPNIRNINKDLSNIFPLALHLVSNEEISQKISSQLYLSLYLIENTITWNTTWKYARTSSSFSKAKDFRIDLLNTGYARIRFAYRDTASLYHVDSVARSYRRERELSKHSRHAFIARRSNVNAVLRRFLVSAVQ